MLLVLKFEKEKCIGCHLCELACSSTKSGVFNPSHARLKIIANYEVKDLNIEAKICNLCKKCVEVCPNEALIIENGHLKLIEDNCIGCGLCEKECPENIISLNKQEKPMICDLCGGSPLCVQWCPHQALTLEVNN